MHITFLNPQGNFDRDDTGWTLHADFGGQLVYVKEVACAMGQLGHQVDIVTRQVPSDPTWDRFAEQIDAYAGQPNVRILRIPCGPRNFIAKEQLWPVLNEWVDGIAAFYKQEDRIPDAATGHYADGGLAAVLLKDRLGIPFTLTGHSLGPQKLDKFVEQEPNLAALLDRFHFDKRIAAERVAMAQAGRIVVSTSEERFSQYGHRLYKGAVDPADDSKFSVIPPGVNLSVFGREQRNDVEQATADKVEQMIARDIPEDRRDLPMVICSSRLERKKNHIELVKAWAQNKQLRDSANLAIVLRGSSDPLRERAQAFKGEALEILDEIVQVMDQAELWPCVTAFDLNGQGELAATYRYLGRERRGVFCLTALHEPFGLAPLEAMAAGLPAVVTKNGGPSESMRDSDGEYGVLVDPQDPQDIARGLNRVVSDEATWQQFQKAGIHRVDTRYTWNRTADAYLLEIKAICAGNSRSNDQYSIPTYFRDTNQDDIDEKWLRGLYEG